MTILVSKCETGGGAEISVLQECLYKYVNKYMPVEIQPTLYLICFGSSSCNASLCGSMT